MGPCPLGLSANTMARSRLTHLSLHFLTWWPANNRGSKDLCGVNSHIKDREAAAQRALVTYSRSRVTRKCQGGFWNSSFLTPNSESWRISLFGESGFFGESTQFLTLNFSSLSIHTCPELLLIGDIRQRSDYKLRKPLSAPK